MLGAYFVCEAEYKHVQPVIVIGEEFLKLTLTILWRRDIMFRSGADRRGSDDNPPLLGDLCPVLQREQADSGP